MKNLILISVCFVLVLFLAGCAEEGVKVVTVSPQGEPAAEQPATTQTQTSTSEPAPQTQTSQQQASTTSVSTKADLEITSYFLSSLNAEQNEEFEVKFKIKNAGTEAITNFEYSIKIMEGNDVIKSNFYNYTPTLGVGETSSKIEYTYSLKDKGTYDVIVKLDPMNNFEEPKETNNEGSQRINIISGNITAATTSSSSSSSSSSSTSTSGCVDTDGGKNYEVKGTCKDEISYLAPLPDFCIESTKIVELYCEDNQCEQIEHTCVCVEGVCT